MPDQPEHIAEKIVGIGEPRHTPADMAEKTGLDLDDLKRIWRALGFVVVEDDIVFFTDEDLEVVRLIVAFLEAGLADLEVVLGITRVMSLSIARIAEAQADAIRQYTRRSPEVVDEIVRTGLPTDVTSQAIEGLEVFLDYTWRRHMAVALERAEILEPADDAPHRAVGFADLVGFSRLSRHAEDQDLARLIESFEGIAQEIVAGAGGRVVKTIGDEVMFLADDAGTGATIALDLLDRLATQEGDLSLRAGLSYGKVVAVRGDFFGPVVNLASRAAQIARPDSALVSEPFRDALSEHEGFTIRPIPRTRIKGFGTTQLFVLRRREARS